MKLHTAFLLALVCSTVFGSAAGAQSWPWRGPTGDGQAPDGQRPVTEWSTSHHVVWKTDLPGRGHSSPVVAGGKIFLTTADEATSTQSVLCLDLAGGNLLWNTVCASGGFLKTIHRNNTHASSTVAIGPDRVFAVFCNHGSTQVVCLDLEGKKLWEKKVCAFAPTKYQFGFAASPVFFEDRVIVTSESETEPVMVALQASDGEEIWRVERPSVTSYSTPVVTSLGGKPRLLLSGGKKVVAYDPASGEAVWEAGGSWVVTCGTLVWSEDRSLVFASGGFPTKQTMAVRTDGSGEVAWTNSVQCYEQSLIVVDGCVYGFAEGGILHCWNASDGAKLWAERLKQGESASPVFAGGHIYITGERGTTWVLRPNREKMQVVATNQLGDETFASLAVVDNQLLIRTADSSGGKRVETLYCLGERQAKSGKPE